MGRNTFAAALLALSAVPQAQPAPWKTYSDATGISVSMPAGWIASENKTFGKVLSYGQSERAADGREVAQGCSVIVLDAPSSRGKAAAVVDKEVDALVRSMPPEKLASALGLEGVTEAAAVPLAGRRAIRVVSNNTDAVTGRTYRTVQVLLFQNGKSFGVNCFSTPADFAAAWPVFERVAQSLRLPR